MMSNHTMKKTVELGLCMATISIALAGCLGSGGGGTSNVAGGGGSSSCGTALTPGTASNGNYGTLTLSGAGATTIGATTLTSQSASYFADPFAKMYAWYSVQLQSGVAPSSNMTSVNLTLDKTTNALLMVSIAKLGATFPGNMWSAGSSVAGVNASGGQLTFTNAALPGITGSAVGSTITLNGTLCM